MASGEVELAASADEGVHEERGYAGAFAGFAAGGLARKTLCQFMLKIPGGAKGLPTALCRVIMGLAATRVVFPARRP